MTYMSPSNINPNVWSMVPYDKRSTLYVNNCDAFNTYTTRSIIDSYIYAACEYILFINEILEIKQLAFYHWRINWSLWDLKEFQLANISMESVQYNGLQDSIIIWWSTKFLMQTASLNLNKDLYCRHTLQFGALRLKFGHWEGWYMSYATDVTICPLLVTFSNLTYTRICYDMSSTCYF